VTSTDTEEESGRWEEQRVRWEMKKQLAGGRDTDAMHYSIQQVCTE